MMHGADVRTSVRSIGERDKRPNKEFSGLPGGNGEREPPDTIPTAEVKTPCADGSVAASHARVGHCQAPHARRPQYESTGAFSLCKAAAVARPRKSRSSPTMPSRANVR